MSRSVKIACCQISPAVGDKPGNLERVQVAVARAAAEGAAVVVLPELANTGYVFANRAELVAEAEPADGPTIRAWEKLAAEHDLVIVAGFAEAAADGAVYNSAVLIDASGVRACYRKAHLWDREKELFTPGYGLPPVVSTPHGRIGMVICYDLGFPEWIRAVALEGAELLCAPVNWPLSRGRRVSGRVRWSKSRRMPSSTGCSWPLLTGPAGARSGVVGRQRDRRRQRLPLHRQHPRRGGDAVGRFDLGEAKDKRLSDRTTLMLIGGWTSTPPLTEWPWQGRGDGST